MRSSEVEVSAIDDTGWSERLKLPVTRFARVVLRRPEQRTAVLSDRVTDESGQPVTSFTVLLVAEPTGRATSNPFLTSDGTFEVGRLAPSHYTVQVESTDFADSAEAQVQALGSQASSSATSFWPW